MRVSRPSFGTVLGALALVVAMGGTAYAATSVVTIGDATKPTQKAKVDATGHLTVGDGTGPLSVDGTVTTRLAAPTTWFHSGVAVANNCVSFPAPPAGQAQVVRQIRVNSYNLTAGVDNYFVVYASPACADQVGVVDVTGEGQTVMPFDPGLSTRTGMSVLANNIVVNAFIDGYTVPAATVPASAVASGSTSQLLPRGERLPGSP